MCKLCYLEALPPPPVFVDDLWRLILRRWLNYSTRGVIAPAWRSRNASLSGQYAWTRGISLQSAAAADGKITLSSPFPNATCEEQLTNRDELISFPEGKLERWTGGRGHSSQGCLFISHSLRTLKRRRTLIKQSTLETFNTASQTHTGADKPLSPRNFSSMLSKDTSLHLISVSLSSCVI